MSAFSGDRSQGGRRQQMQKPCPWTEVLLNVVAVLSASHALGRCVPCAGTEKVTGRWQPVGRGHRGRVESSSCQVIVGPQTVQPKREGEENRWVRAAFRGGQGCRVRADGGPGRKGSPRPSSADAPVPIGHTVRVAALPRLSSVRVNSTTHWQGHGPRDACCRQTRKLRREGRMLRCGCAVTTRLSYSSRVITSDGPGGVFLGRAPGDSRVLGTLAAQALGVGQARWLWAAPGGLGPFPVAGEYGPPRPLQQRDAGGQGAGPAGDGQS